MTPSLQRLVGSQCRTETAFASRSLPRARDVNPCFFMDGAASTNRLDRFRPRSPAFASRRDSFTPSSNGTPLGVHGWACGDPSLDHAALSLAAVGRAPAGHTIRQAGRENGGHHEEEVVVRRGTPCCFPGAKGAYSAKRSRNQRPCPRFARPSIG
jgi:hypothetical protein